MFEEYTYEKILSQMLNNVSDEFDKREGSLLYTALAPAAAELAQMYIALDAYARSKWVQTAADDDLDNFAYMFGVERKMATFAKIKAVFCGSGGMLVDVPIGSRYGLNGVFYTVTELISPGTYLLQAETSGETGNQTGTLLPVNYIEGLVSVKAESIEIYGEETESDDELRARLVKKITNGAQDGNIAQYLEWAENYDGIGRAKVFPLINNDISQVSIIDPYGKPASATLIAAFQDYLDPGSEGLGSGKAPIGAKIQVVTAEPLNISLSISLIGTATQEEITAVVEEYFSDIAFVKNAVSYFRAAAYISSLSTVEQIQDLKINGSASDVIVGSNQVPILKSVVISNG